VAAQVEDAHFWSGLGRRAANGYEAAVRIVSEGATVLAESMV